MGYFDCWPWPQGLHNEGYGLVKVEGKTQRAHRVAYQEWVGPLSAEEILHHTCHNKACYNPAHLERTTQQEHCDSVGAIHRAKTHCPQGHEYSLENTYHDPNEPQRRCRICRRESVRRCRRRKALASASP